MRVVKKVEWFCLGSSESKVLTFILLSCSHVHSVTWPISRSSSLLRPFKIHIKTSSSRFKSFWSNESLIREICHAKKSSCEWNVGILWVCKPVFKMRILGGLCLHLVAGYQVSLRILCWWHFSKVGDTKIRYQHWCSRNEFRRNGIQLETRSMTIGQIVQVLMRPVFITKFSFYWTLWLVGVITNESNWKRNKCVIDSPNRGDCFSCPCSDRMPKIECSDKLSHLQDQCFKSNIISVG